MGHALSKPRGQRRRRRFRRRQSASAPPPPPPLLHEYARSGNWDSFLARLESHPDEALVAAAEDPHSPSTYMLTMMLAEREGGIRGGSSSASVLRLDAADPPGPNVLRVGLTPLHILCIRRPPARAVRSLIDADPTAALSLTVRDGRLPLHLACYSSASRSVVEELLLPPSPVNGDGGAGDGDGVSVVVDPSQAISIQDYYGWTPLHIACRFGASPGVLDAMLRSGSGRRHAYAAAALRTGDNAGRIPLHVACDYFAGLALDDFSRLVEADVGGCWVEDGADADVDVDVDVAVGGSNAGPIGGDGGQSAAITPARDRAGLLPLECLCREYRSAVERALSTVAKWPWMPSVGPLTRGDRESYVQRQYRYRRSLGSNALGTGGIVGAPDFDQPRDWAMDVAESDDHNDVAIEHAARIGRLFQDMDELCEFYGKARILVRAMCGAEDHGSGSTPPPPSPSTQLHPPPHPNNTERIQRPCSMLHGCLSIEDCPLILTWFAFLVDPWQARVQDGDGNTPLHIAAATVCRVSAVHTVAKDEGDSDIQKAGLPPAIEVTSRGGSTINYWDNASSEKDGLQHLIEALLDHYPDAASTPNRNGYIPLQLITGAAARETKVAGKDGGNDDVVAQFQPGWNDGVGFILLSWPQALESLDLPDRLYPHALSRFTRALTKRSLLAGTLTPLDENSKREEKGGLFDDCDLMTPLYLLLRERPNLLKMGQLLDT